MASCTKDDNNNGSNGEDNTGGSSNPGTEQPAPVPAPPVGEWVDLGLPSGLLWASCNVGATAPGAYGTYFAWAETSAYSPNSHIYWNNGGYTKYYYSDGLTILQPEDDAATANWGNGARTPTKEEWEELMSNTTVEWITSNGIGRLFTSRINGKSIFLPAAGSKSYSNEPGAVGDQGEYWSATLWTSDKSCAWRFFFTKHDQEVNRYGNRKSGYSVRPVHSAR